MQKVFILNLSGLFGTSRDFDFIKKELKSLNYLQKQSFIEADPKFQNLMIDHPKDCDRIQDPKKLPQNNLAPFDFEFCDLDIFDQDSIHYVGDVSSREELVDAISTRWTTFLQTRWSGFLSKPIIRPLNNPLYKPLDKPLLIFMGYSLGGRLGLDFIARQKGSIPFDHFFYLSTHPGFESDISTQKMRDERRHSDQSWLKKWEQLSQNDFFEKWNSQPVFKNSLQNPPVESHRWSHISLGFKELSLAYQKDFRSFIQSQKSNIHWLVGESDQKFCDIAQELFKNQMIENLEIIKSAGHRIHLDKPREVAKIIYKTILEKQNKALSLP